MILGIIAWLSTYYINKGFFLITCCVLIYIPMTAAYIRAQKKLRYEIRKRP